MGSNPAGRIEDRLEQLSVSPVGVVQLDSSFSPSFNPPLRLMSIRDYRFVITIMWFAFVTALSFIETPLRFAADGVQRVDSLSIGHLVFHALNYSELVFATLLLIGEYSCRLNPTSRDRHLNEWNDDSDVEYDPASNYLPARDGCTSKLARRLLLFIVGLLLLQTVLLFTVLDYRTLAIINGQEVGKALYHMAYVGMEFVKWASLIWLSAVQIENFKRQFSSFARY